VCAQDEALKGVSQIAGVVADEHNTSHAAAQQ